MWTSTLDLDPKRVVVTQLLRRFWRGACFSSFAPLQVQNIPRQALPATSWVRVRTRLAGICGSDLHLIQVDGDLRIAPAAIPQQRRSYPGHEVVGEVLEVGADVQFLNVGDRVALQYGPNCLSTGMQPLCRSCALGHYNLCERGNLPPPHPIGGGWSEEMLLHEQQLFHIPTDMNDEQAVLLEPASVAVHAVLRHLPRSGDRVLIVGAGTIGLLTLQTVRALAPQAEISVLARHPFQVEQATRLGAAHIIYPQDSYIGIQRATGAQFYQSASGNRTLLGGYDVIYDSVGSQKTLHHALRWARTQATVVLVGLSPHMMHIDLTPVWYHEVNLIGSMGSGVEAWPPASSEQRTTFEVAAELIKRGLLNPENLITHRFPLNNYQAAITTAAEKAQSRAVKVVFDYSLLPASVVPNVRASAARRRRAARLSPDTLLAHDEQTPEEGSFPVEALALSTPIETAVLPVAQSPATTLREDDELDMMEDTLKAPALAKQTEQPGMREHIDIYSLPTIPINMEELASVGPLTVEKSSTISVSQVEDLPIMETTPAAEEPPVATQTPQMPQEPSGLPAVDIVINIEEMLTISELFATQPAVGSQYVPVEDEQTADATPEPSEPVIAETRNEPPDSPETTTASIQDESPDLTADATPEPSEPATMEIQDDPPDFVEKEEARETGGSAATGEDNNALLSVEESATIQVQARPRTRKRNSRTTQRGKK